MSTYLNLSRLFTDMFWWRYVAYLDSGSNLRVGWTPAQPLPDAVPHETVGTHLRDDCMADTWRWSTTGCWRGVRHLEIFIIYLHNLSHLIQHILTTVICKLPISVWYFWKCRIDFCLKHTLTGLVDVCVVCKYSFLELGCFLCILCMYLRKKMYKYTISPSRFRSKLCLV